MAYVINGKHFPSQSDIQNHVSQILNDGHINTKLLPEEKAFMIEFFATFHHEWIIKKGPGIKHVWRVKNQLNNRHNAFIIERVDGSVTDISCRIDRIKRRDVWYEFSIACRFVIKPQIDEFRRVMFAKSAIQKCPYTGEALSPEGCHVDHHPITFNEIVQSFIDKHQISDLESIVSNPADNQWFPLITDPLIANSFFVHHKRTATLRLLSSHGNLVHAKK